MLFTRKKDKTIMSSIVNNIEQYRKQK